MLESVFRTSPLMNQQRLTSATEFLVVVSSAGVIPTHDMPWHSVFLN